MPATGQAGVGLSAGPGWRDESVQPQPIRAPAGPARYSLQARSKPESMGAVLVKVHFIRHARFLEGRSENDAVLDRDAGVIDGMDQECRWCVAVDLFFIRKQCHQ